MKVLIPRPVVSGRYVKVMADELIVTACGTTDSSVGCVVLYCLICRLYIDCLICRLCGTTASSVGCVVLLPHL